MCHDAEGRGGDVRDHLGEVAGREGGRGLRHFGPMSRELIVEVRGMA